MNILKSIFALFSLTLFSSCVSTSFYQVYKVEPEAKLTLNSNTISYQDENCRVSYNFWQEGGDIGFQFYNKTDKNIYLNLEESFFILNGFSYNYYRNRIFTRSTSAGLGAARSASASNSLTGINYLNLIQNNRIASNQSVGLMMTSGVSISYSENKVVCIPPMTSKLITEYLINESLYRDCDIFKYPAKNEIKTKTFSKVQSPLVFGNRLAYSIEGSSSLIRFSNEFYVSEITNLPEDKMIESVTEEYCGQKATFPTKQMKNPSVDKFYIKYSKGGDVWKH